MKVETPNCPLCDGPPEIVLLFNEQWGHRCELIGVTIYWLADGIVCSSAPFAEWNVRISKAHHK